jgi:ATP-dependent RNA helicase HelY
VTGAGTPAERYRAAKERSADPVLAELRGGYDFDLDAFQLDGVAALAAGRSVLVCAPTGAGKTVVGEYAVARALAAGQKCFYTTPIKALSNQKFRDLAERYGPERVGLLTGDVSINPDAPAVVMTTEVLRNMLYVGSSALAGLSFVVMDEVHYLGDQFRGAVWEEVIIHLPASVQIAALSATVSNAEEFGDWLATVRGATDVIVHEERPVPLWQHMLVGTELFDLFEDAAQTVLDAHLLRRVAERVRRLDLGAGPGRTRSRSRRYDPGRGWRPPSHAEVIARLDRDGLLPAITFIFSRAGCEAAVRSCRHSGLWLTDEGERDEIRAVAEAHTAELAAEDLAVLGYGEWLEGLQRGVAAHHAGLVPAFKEAVEELFGRGMVKAVFATETLALGINMPARSVVLERLRKFNGDTHIDVTPGEYTQLTGRAGRRGIDVEGHAVVLWRPQVDPRHVAGLAATRTYPLRSSFRPSYNMAVNLVGQLGRPAARALLERSFAQFQADRSVVGQARQVTALQAAADREDEAAACHLGDIGEYAELRRELSQLEAHAARSARDLARAEAAAGLERLTVGDVIQVPRGRRTGLAVVLDTGSSAVGEARPLVLTAERWAGRVALPDFAGPVEVLGRLRVPKHFNHRSPQARRDLASALRELGIPPPSRARRPSAEATVEDRVSGLRDALRRHPCQACPDREAHLRGRQRAQRLRRELEELARRVNSRTDSLGRQFERVCTVLADLGYLAGDTRTALGEQLSGVWGETDLLTVQVLNAGCFAGLTPSEVAALASALLYEGRRDDPVPVADPGGALGAALARLHREWARLVEREAQHGVDRTRAPDPGLVAAILAWAGGAPLARVLTVDGVDDVLSAGDFVRWCRQVIDLLEQIARATAPAPIAAQARAAAEACRRGVVLA